MALFGRMARLLSADLNAVIDGLEEPETLLLQAIREMEDELSVSRGQLQLLRTGVGELQTQKTQIERRIDKLGDELDLCFAAGSDELARNLIRRKLQLERMLETTDAKLDDAQSRLESDLARHGTCEQALTEMKEKAEIVRTRSGHDHGGIQNGSFEQAVGSDEIEAAFLREKQARSTS